MPQDALAGGSIGVGIDESADAGIIIARLQIIEFSLSIVDVATVAKRIGFRKGSGGSQDIAVGVIAIACNHCTASVHDRYYVTLEVGYVVIHSAVVLQYIRHPASIVEEVQCRCTVSFTQQLAACIVIAVCGPVHRLPGSQAIRIIGVGYAVAASAGTAQSSALRPAETPLGPVVVAGGIARCVIGYGMPVHRRQQIRPGVVSVGVGMAVAGTPLYFTITSYSY